MKVISDIKEMQKLSEEIRLSGRKIAFIPTMGFLHEGHFSLVREGKRRSDVTVVSIFVNPTQFDSQKDLQTYPCNIDHDLSLLEREGVHIVFTPTSDSIYPQHYQTFVEVIEVTKGLCGARRPGHFKGVTTIVAKLFNIVKPHIALFGEKDYQQLVTIKRMVDDLNFDIEIVGMPTVREKDGLAMSSRNSRLNPEERTQALALYRSLKEAQKLFQKGERDAKLLKKEIYRILEKEKNVRIDYIEICDPKTLVELDEIKEESLVAIAAFVGENRLIDNFILR